MVINAEDILMKWLNENPEIREEYLKNHKSKNDPRETKIGKLLRKTSLDELPQLFNIFLGNMSLVGPRPYMQREFNDCRKYAKFLWRVKPGLTGLWQVSGRSDIDFEERMKLETNYVLNWSFWLDIQIIFKTIPVILNKNGAY